MFSIYEVSEDGMKARTASSTFVEFAKLHDVKDYGTRHFRRFVILEDGTQVYASDSRDDIGTHPFVFGLPL